MSEKHKVFVYGTLKKEGKRSTGNHSFFLGKSKMLGKDNLDGFVMLDLGAFPGIIHGAPGQKILGEVYEISDETLQSLDYLEGHPSHYMRETVTLDSGQSVFTYIYQRPDANVETIKDGIW